MAKGHALSVDYSDRETVPPSQDLLSKHGEAETTVQGIGNYGRLQETVSTQNTLSLGERATLLQVREDTDDRRLRPPTVAFIDDDTVHPAGEDRMPLNRPLTGIETHFTLEDVHDEHAWLFAPDETFHAGFELHHGYALFTNLRCIFVTPGADDSDSDYLSIPYSRINSYASSTDFGDLESKELHLWVAGTLAVPEASGDMLHRGNWRDSIRPILKILSIYVR